jgi:hypothetical protein
MGGFRIQMTSTFRVNSDRLSNRRIQRAGDGITATGGTDGRRR